MPALYRMPAFYLAVALIGGAAGIGLSLGRAGQGATSSAEPPPTSSTAAPSQVADLAPPAQEEPPSDEILRTAEGLRRKVLVKELDLVPKSAPLDGRQVPPALDYFSFHFLLAEESPGGGLPRMLQVGPETGAAEGWVPAGSVLEWNTRLMARPTPRTGRPPLVIYREQACLLDALAGRNCPRHAGKCPTEGEEAAGSTDPGASPAAGLPILESLSIPQPDGTERTVFRVASLVRDEAPPVLPDQPTPDMQPLLKRIDIAFVIDTTKSMQAHIDAARAMADALVRDAAARHQGLTLRLGLVEYRDDSPSYGFRTRVATQFTDPSGFRDALATLKAADRGDGSVDEDVLDGVAAALPRPEGEPVTVMDHLEWPTGRAGKLATRMVVLLGDAPDHATDLRRAEALARHAADDRITIAAVSIARPGRSRDEDARYGDQWRTLAEGSYRPIDTAGGFDGPIAPILPALGPADDSASAAEIAARLQSLIEDRVKAARELAALAAAEAENRLAAYVDARGLSLDRVYPVLVDLHRDEPQPAARPDPRAGGVKAPSVRDGWIPLRQDGHAMIDVEMLMSKTELDDLIRELTTLAEAVQSNAAGTADLLRIGTAAAAGESAFLAADRGSQTFADHLRRRQGLPPAKPDSLLRRSQNDLLQADDLYRNAVSARLADSLSRLVTRRNQPDWDDPDRLVQGRGLVPYDAIDF